MRGEESPQSDGQELSSYDLVPTQKGSKGRQQEVDAISALAWRRKYVQAFLCKELERQEPETPSFHHEKPGGSRLPKSTRRDEVDLETMVREDQ